MGDLPIAVALAVPVPEPKDPSYAAFVVLATGVSRTSPRARRGRRTALATAFSLGRRRQLGIDAAALDHALHTVTAEQLAPAAQRFDGTSSAAVLAGGKS